MPGEKGTNFQLSATSTLVSGEEDSFSWYDGNNPRVLATDTPVLVQAGVE